MGNSLMSIYVSIYTHIYIYIPAPERHYYTHQAIMETLAHMICAPFCRYWAMILRTLGVQVCKASAEKNKKKRLRPWPLEAHSRKVVGRPQARQLIEVGAG